MCPGGDTQAHCPAVVDLICCAWPLSRARYLSFALICLLARERDVLIRRRVRVAGNQAEARLADSGTYAVDEGLLPQVGVDRLLVHDLLHLVQLVLALL